jgi:hypothetical protein
MFEDAVIYYGGGASLNLRSILENAPAWPQKLCS